MEILAGRKPPQKTNVADRLLLGVERQGPDRRLRPTTLPCPSIRPDKSSMLKHRLAFAFCLPTYMWTLASTAEPVVKTADPDHVLADLMTGNRRFVTGHSVHPHQAHLRLTSVAQMQHPTAAMLSCSDSRVPPEIVFDRGLGDLFVVRVAGNTAGDVALGSMEYAVEHLGVKVLVVLGHKRCGAVSAAVAGGEATRHIGALVEAAVAIAKEHKGDVVDNAVHINVEQVVAKIRASKPILAEAVEVGHLKVVGPYYDLDTGRITVLP